MHAQNAALSKFERMKIAEELWKLGSKDIGAKLVLDIALAGKTDYYDTREDAALQLWKWNLRDMALRAYSHLAADPEIDDRDRMIEAIHKIQDNRPASEFNRWGGGRPKGPPPMPPFAPPMPL